MEIERPNMDEQAEGFFPGALKNEIKRALPNFERVGCPDQSVLRKMSEDPNSYTQEFYHILMCGACVRDFEYYQRRDKHRRYIVKKGLALAASAFLALGLWWYVSLRFSSVNQEKKPGIARQISVPPVTGGSQAPGSGAGKPNPGRGTIGPVVPNTAAEVWVPIIHYTVTSAVRGAQPETTEPEALTLIREVSQLKIHLALGSEPGTYEVRLHRQMDKKEVGRWKADASKDNDYTLAIKDDFGKFPRGDYLLAIFPPGLTGEVTGHPVKLIDKK